MASILLTTRSFTPRDEFRQTKPAVWFGSAFSSVNLRLRVLGLTGNRELEASCLRPCRAMLTTPSCAFPVADECLGVGWQAPVYQAWERGSRHGVCSC